MRIVFATSNLFIPTDLARKYADVEIIGGMPSFSATISVVRDTQGGISPVEVAVLEARLISAIDTEAKMSLSKAIAELRMINPDLRIVVSTPSPMTAADLDGQEVDVLVEIEQRRAAANLATHLQLSPIEDVARIFTIASLQGGAGRTYVAKNLAATFVPALRDQVQEGRGGVLLWELDLHHPTLGFTTGFSPATLDNGRRTVAGLLNADTLSLEGSVDAVMSKVLPFIIPMNENPIGCDLLLAPHGLREIMAVYQAYPDLPELQHRLSRILDILSRYYKVIVIDTGYDLLTDPGATLAISRADVLVGVVAPGPAGLSAATGLGIIISDMSLGQKTQIILNTGVQNDQSYIPFMKEIFNKTPMAEPILLGAAPRQVFWIAVAERLGEMRR
jgi:MinD-like ATPase involved in chromosome partitioning or flagellar assembly